MSEPYNYHEEEALGISYDGRLMKRLLSYARPYWLIIFACIILLFIVTAAELARPYLVKIAIDDYITPGPLVVWEAGNEPQEGIEYRGRIYIPQHRLTKEYPDRPMAQLLTYEGRYYLVDDYLGGTEYSVRRDGVDLILDTEAGFLTVSPLEDVEYRAFRQPDQTALVRLALLYLGVIALSFSLNYLQIYLLHRTGQQIIFNIRHQVFSHLQRLSLRFFDTNPVGRLVTRVTNDTETLDQMFTGVVVYLFKDLFMLLGIVIVMLQLNVRLALVSFSLIPVVIIATIVFRLKAREAYREVRVRLARINSALAENITGVRTVQIFHRMGKKHQEFNDINHAHYRASFRELKIFAVFRPFIDLIYFLALALLIWYGGGSVVQGLIPFGVLYAFIQYLEMFFRPINDMAEKYNIMQSAMASSERIFQLLDTTVDTQSPQQPVPVKVKGRIEFCNVWFAYNPGEWVLRDVSFTIEKGQTVAFVGATGAGKTSIINLISRLYDIQKGQILIDGVDIKEIDLDHLRKNVAVVLQDVFMFSGTIADNIRLNSDIDDQQIRHIAEAVDAHRFISRLPRDYESEVKERGATMSAGQRQLLAFARALAFKPKILILDEATANIDTETEQVIQKAMKTISRGRTTLVVAHRLSTIQSADKIIVMHKGKLREEGNHQQLLARGGYYYNLYQLQYKEQEASQ
ncbi:MAG: ABC transporter ATP-binding protein [Bacillota bacterium]|nr:ABC transporter ATP-binding protein [Bacillota bacterium]